MQNKPTLIRKSALAVFKDKKILLTREEKNDNAFYMLGGTIEPGEDEIDCLNREVQEEVATTIKEGSLKFLAEFEDIAHGRANARINIKLYEGELVSNPTPSNEVVELKYFDSNIDPKHLTPVSIQIFKWLKEHDYIN
jgi:8-oxo-dGTP pyrophosphatase MutT (NUDIX family)